MPDAALQRLRRAQHPGDRGQARPADPQRDEHRCRPRRLRPRHRPPGRALRHRGRPRATSRGAGSRTRTGRLPSLGSRRSATSSARSRPRSTTARPRRRGRHRRDRRRRHVLERAQIALDRYFPHGGFDEVCGGRGLRRALLGPATDHFLELTHRDRERIFNLGYYTWVEQQGVSIEDFEARRDPAILAEGSASRSPSGTT